MIERSSQEPLKIRSDENVAIHLLCLDCSRNTRDSEKAIGSQSTGRRPEWPATIRSEE
jgi:hypothetical protein